MEPTAEELLTKLRLRYHNIQSGEFTEDAFIDWLYPLLVLGMIGEQQLRAVTIIRQPQKDKSWLEKLVDFDWL